MIKNNLITVFPKSVDLFQYAAKDFAKRAIATVKEKEFFSVVLAGGSTPKTLFEILAGDDFYQNTIPWQQIQFFFGDERYVPADDRNNNFQMTQEYLFSKVPVKPTNIYRIPTDYQDPADAAKFYEAQLREVFGIKDNAFPSFDLVYLGLGDNAHTASLMPFSNLIKDYVKGFTERTHQLAASLYVPELNMFRITLTPMAINHGLNIIFLVTGSDKATAVKNVLEGEINPVHYPAQLIDCLDRKTMWYLDQAAAKKLQITEN